jgi:hypothetical protein
MVGSLFRKCYAAALFTVLAVIPYAAQEEHHHHAPDEKIGKVNFLTACSKRAQIEFNRGVAWLHSFEYAESERVFREIANNDFAMRDGSLGYRDESLSPTVGSSDGSRAREGRCRSQESKGDRCEDQT